MEKKFFECNRIDKCTHVVKLKNSKGFTLISGKEEMEKESEYDVIYEKITIATRGVLSSLYAQMQFCLRKCLLKCKPVALIVTLFPLYFGQKVPNVLLFVQSTLCSFVFVFVST